MQKWTPSHPVRLLYFTLPLLLFGISFWWTYAPPLRLNFASPSLTITPFNDQSNQGNSDIHLKNRKTGNVQFTYQLHDGFEFPFVGVRWAPETDSFFRWSCYDNITFKVKATKGTRLPIVMGTFIPGSTFKEYLSYQYLEQIIEVDTSLNTIEIPFHSFIIPEWWLKEHSKTTRMIEAPDFNRVGFLNIQSCHVLSKSIEDEVTIQEIILTKDFRSWWIACFVLLILYLAVAWAMARKKQVTTIEPAKEVVFHYDKTTSSNRLEKEERTVFDYLATHYTNPDLSITAVQQAIGISETKIAGIIKRSTALTFKQFLNKLRLAESKRLLKESDLQVAEIAYKVGYGNISHFNRTFKEYEQTTPIDFRKTVQNAL